MQDYSHDDHALPLKGVVLCSTSLAQDVRVRSNQDPWEEYDNDFAFQELLSSLARSMGAFHRLDLTTDVTHLIVGQLDTPKYKHVAKERPDIKVLMPEWVEALRDAWRSGKDFSTLKLEQQYMLPTFSGLTICVTGFDDIEQRNYIINTIGEQGGTYSGDLDRSVTHLIAKTPQGPKYNRAKLWKMKIVSLKWFDDSIKRGMTLDEGSYDPLLPIEAQGQDAFIGFAREPSVTKRTHEDAGSSFGEENGKRKLRRTKSSRLNNDSQTMWAEMSMAEDVKQIKNEDEWNEAGRRIEDIPVIPQEDPPPRDITPTVSGNGISRPVSRAAGSIAEPRSLFSSCLFVVMGHPEKRCRKILEILQNEGGQIADFPEDLSLAVDSESHTITALIVPSEWTASTADPLPDIPSATWIVTEWWIERCIISKLIVDPERDVYSQSRMKLPGDCFKGMIISTSGFGNDAKHVSSIAVHTGATYEENFKPTCSVLIVRSPDTNPDKIEYALKHRVPIVSECWFLACLNQDKRLPLEPYQTVASKADNRRQQISVEQSLEPQALPRRKDDTLAQRLSITRKKGVTPSLMLVKSRSVLPQSEPRMINSKVETKTKVRNSIPFLQEEDDSSTDETGPAQLDGAHSQPLGELPLQMANSPEKKSQTTSAEPVQPQSFAAREYETVDGSVLTHIKIGYVPTDDAGMDPGSNENMAPDLATETMPPPGEQSSKPQPVEANNMRLSEDIRLLLDRRKDALAPTETSLSGRRRKDRKLGRAPSNMSNPSAPPSFTHSRSIEIANSTASASPLDLGVPLPSQQLGYEAIDAREHRARMSKQMGTKFGDDGIGVRVESIGVVRDVDTEGGGTGVANRVRGRHRNPKT